MTSYIMKYIWNVGNMLELSQKNSENLLKKGVKIEKRAYEKKYFLHGNFSKMGRLSNHYPYHHVLEFFPDPLVLPSIFIKNTRFYRIVM